MTKPYYRALGLRTHAPLTHSPHQFPRTKPEVEPPPAPKPQSPEPPHAKFVGRARYPKPRPPEPPHLENPPPFTTPRPRDRRVHRGIPKALQEPILRTPTPIHHTRQMRRIHRGIPSSKRSKRSRSSPWPSPPSPPARWRPGACCRSGSGRPR